MQRALGKLTHPFLLPGGFLFLAALLAAPHLRVALPRPYPEYAHFAFLALGVFLGWRFNRSRIVFALVALALANRLLARCSSGPAQRFAADAIPLILPLLFAVLSFLSERNLLSLHGLARFSLLAAPALGFTWLYRTHHASAIAWMETPLLPWTWLNAFPLHQPALAAYLAAAGTLSLRRRLTALDGGFFWALAASVPALLHPTRSQEATFWFTASALILALAVIETSHFMAFRDELTGLPARRALNEALLQAGGQYAVAMVDIDHFKKINDRHGHDVGDQVLRMVAAKLAGASGGGRAFRYGGEEFTILFQGKDLEESLPHLEDLRQAIASAAFVVRSRMRPRKKPSQPRARQAGRRTVPITVSIGAAERDGKNSRTDQVVKAADRALYRAKRGGRNQVRS